MVGHLLIIDKGSPGPDLPFENRVRKCTVRSHGHRRHSLPERLRHIGGQIPGIRPRISEHLMMLIKALHQIERLFGGKSIPLVGVPLQGRQIIQPVQMRSLLCLFHRDHPSVRIFRSVVCLISGFFRENRGAAAAPLLPCKCDALPPCL